MKTASRITLALTVAASMFALAITGHAEWAVGDVYTGNWSWSKDDGKDSTISFGHHNKVTYVYMGRPVVKDIPLQKYNGSSTEHYIDLKNDDNLVLSWNGRDTMNAKIVNKKSNKVQTTATFKRKK